jgi:hypothetical protein
VSTPADDFALLLEASDPTEVELARGLLSEAGIPCFVHGPDFDVAELGRAAHDVVRRPNVYVPKAALERAQAVLARAWGEDAVEDEA